MKQPMMLAAFLRLVEDDREHHAFNYMKPESKGQAGRWQLTLSRHDDRLMTRMLARRSISSTKLASPTIRS